MLARLLLTFAALAFAATTALGQAAKPEAKPAASKPAATKPAPAAAAKPEAEPPHVKIIQEIFTCIAPELPKEWIAAWVMVNEIGRSQDGKSRNFEANIRYTETAGDTEGKELKPCDSGKVVASVGDLNEFLKPEERSWTAMVMVFGSDGKFEVKYDYTPVKYDDATGKPAAKPAAQPLPKPGFRIGN